MRAACDRRFAGGLTASRSLPDLQAFNPLKASVIALLDPAFHRLLVCLA